MTDIKMLTPKECAERLLNLERVAVLTHARPDADTVGTAAALCTALIALGKDAVILSPDPIPKRLRFLVEKLPLADEPSGRVAVAVDVASRNQLGRLSELDVALTVDHHATCAPFSDHYTVGESSSAAEVLYYVLCELEAISEFRMSHDVAYGLYAAMSSDTGGFIYSSADAKAHRVAAELIGYGIDFADINHRLFNSKSEERIKAEGVVGSKIKSALSGKVSYATLSKKERDEIGLPLEEFDGAVDVVRALEGAEIAFFVRECDDGTLRASIRSTGFNVAQIAAELGGGGHIRAAGCSPKAESAEAAAELIVRMIKERL
ncbi:MAG: DHH family phosphoesterase [Clostridia bacterium]|nr:DHH family phosphoesterase [Clostridia bacterium]